MPTTKRHRLGRRSAWGRSMGNVIIATTTVASVMFVATHTAFSVSSFRSPTASPPINPVEGGADPTPAQFDTLTLASGGTPAARTLVIETKPTSGVISADTTTGVLTYAPAPTTTGTQSVNFTLCEDDGTTCSSATLSFGAGRAINTAYSVPTLGGYAHAVTYLATNAPASVAPGATFSEEFALRRCSSRHRRSRADSRRRSRTITDLPMSFRFPPMPPTSMPRVGRRRRRQDRFGGHRR